MKVEIKTWKEMEEEYGLDEEGDIDCKDSFVDDMEIAMPPDRIIEIEKHDFDGLYYWDAGKE